jgi:mono/diheme cytochrome c family protein
MRCLEPSAHLTIGKRGRSRDTRVTRVRRILTYRRRVSGSEPLDVGRGVQRQRAIKLRDEDDGVKRQRNSGGARVSVIAMHELRSNNESRGTPVASRPGVRWIVGCLVVAACATEPASDTRYLDDRGFRRQALVAGLVEPSNAYSQLRLARYAIDGGWDALPEWNPPVAIAGEPAMPLALDGDLGDLGEQAFYRYPVQLWPSEPLGLWSDAARGTGLVRVELATGTYTAASCATCHATVRDGALVAGLANASLDLGWGPGRLDVSTTDGHEPVRIPDLRPVRWQTHLHADATVRQPDVTALAIRIETLLITSHAEAVRPPRVVALALATYLWTLAPDDPPPPPPPQFASACGGCHAGDGLTGLPVPLDVVGTDPIVGRSRDRGTGMYRVPSLRGVRERALLLHDGSVDALDALLDPTRTIPGHRFGTSLPADDRAAIVGYLMTL